MGEKKEILRVRQQTSRRFGLNSDAGWAWIIDSTQPLAPGIPAFNGIWRGDSVVSVFGSLNGVRGKVYHDHAFEIETPFTKKDLDERIFQFAAPPYADFDSVYNFYVNSYEGLIGENVVDERVIPNMYAFLLVLQESDPEDVIVSGDDSTIDDIFERHVTLENTVKDTLFATDANGAVLTRDVLNRTPESQIHKSSKNQYFDKYAKNYSDFQTLVDNNNAQAVQVRNKFTNIVAPLTDIELYRDFNNNKNKFPMGMDISFSTDTNTDFAEALKESKMSSTLIKDLIEGPSNFKELSTISEQQQVHPEWRIPPSSGLVVWVGKSSEDFFTNGFIMYVNQNSVYRTSTNVRINTTPSYFLGDEVRVTDWNHAYMNPVDNNHTIAASPNRSADPRSNYEIFYGH